MPELSLACFLLPCRSHVASRPRMPWWSLSSCLRRRHWRKLPSAVVLARRVGALHQPSSRPGSLCSSSRMALPVRSIQHDEGGRGRRESTGTLAPSVLAGAAAAPAGGEGMTNEASGTCEPTTGTLLTPCSVAFFALVLLLVVPAHASNE